MLKRCKSTENKALHDFLQIGKVSVNKSLPKASMIQKLNANEANYEFSKIIFRKRFRFGTISDCKSSNWMDKGKFLKKFAETGTSYSSWIIYLYKKLNWWNQQFKEKYRWWGVLNNYISNNMKKLLKEREELLNNFQLNLQKSASAGPTNRTFWKGIETTGSNFAKFKKLKQHIKMENHPLNKIIVQYQKWMASAYNFLLHPLERQIDFEKVQEDLVDEVHRFIALLYFTTIKFYNLTFKDNDNNTDILLEILTNRVLKGKLYIALYNVISYTLKNQTKLIQSKMNVNDYKYTEGISEIFTLDEESRRNRMNGQSSSYPRQTLEVTETLAHPERRTEKYEKCITLVRKLDKVQITNPTDKIQLLVKVVNQIKKEVDQFWDGIDINQDEKCIDAENMEKLLLYVILKSGYHKILVDLEIIELFAGNYIDYSCNGYIFASFSSAVKGMLVSEDEETESDEKLWDTPGFKSKSERQPSSDNSIESEQNEKA